MSLGEVSDDMDGVGGDVRWMTYAELGHVRGISTASATRLAFRRKWQRQAGNDGTARVAVPANEARRQIERAHDDVDDTEEVAGFIVLSAEPIGRVMLLEASHTSDASFDPTMVLLKSIIQIDTRPVVDVAAQR